MPYYVKAIFAGVMTLLGSVGATLAQISDGAAFGDITTLGWVLIISTTLGAVGGVLGLQQAPATVSTSIR